MIYSKVREEERFYREERKEEILISGVFGRGTEACRVTQKGYWAETGDTERRREQLF